jgi:hypothetical protein
MCIVRFLIRNLSPANVFSLKTIISESSTQNKYVFLVENAITIVNL